MQDKYTEFDFQLKSIMEDAQIRPRRRVWRFVSKRLDASDSSVVWPVWAVSFAIAAALAVGLFFRGTNQIERLEVPALTARADEIKLLPLERSRQIKEYRRPELVAIVEPEVAENTISVEEVVTEAPSSQTNQIISETTRQSYSSDPFAILEAENRHASNERRTSIYAKGIISGNDSDIGPLKSFASMAPGADVAGITELGKSTFSVPFTVGIGIRVYLFPRVSIGTGVDYSLLTRSFTGKYSKITDGGTTTTEAANVQHTLQYLGVPVNIYYDIFSTKRLKFYAYGGAEVEYCFSNKYTVRATPVVTHQSKVQKLQWSLGAGLGMEFGLSKTLGLFLDPGLKYYFPSYQPRSVRTERPLMVNFDAGLRFNF